MEQEYLFFDRFVVYPYWQEKRRNNFLQSLRNFQQNSDLILVMVILLVGQNMVFQSLKANITAVSEQIKFLDEKLSKRIIVPAYIQE